MPRAGIDRHKVLAAALQLADDEGLDALTMRKLGTVLGVEAPSLYKHVSGKPDILDGLTELVYGEVVVPGGDEPWQERLEMYSQSFRAALLGHPNVAPVCAIRPVFSPSTLKIVEQALREFSGIGLPAHEALHALNALIAMVVGHVLTELATTPAFGGTDPEKLAEIRSALPANEFPYVANTLAQGPIDRDAEFALGVKIYTAGLEKYISDESPQL